MKDGGHDPTADKSWKMPNGDLAALEVCDAVESDDMSYLKLGVRVSDFVLPPYFSAAKTGPFDFRNMLRAPCPALTSGGYMSIEHGGAWTQVQQDRHDGMRGRRNLMPTRWRQRARNAGGLADSRCAG